MTPDLQPDQIAARWDDHVCVYEEVFEPFSLALADPLLQRLGARSVQSRSQRLLDVAAGPGGAALALARDGFAVTAIDASSAMVARIRARADDAGLCIDASPMDAQALGFPDSVFDSAISVFGVVLLPDAAGALGEMRRVVSKGGVVGIVTWTEPQNYDLASLLNASADDVWPGRPRGGLPAQLRYREADDLRGLFVDAGLPPPQIERVEATLAAPDADWLSQRISFAPGMSSMLESLGDRRSASIARFNERLHAQFGGGVVRLNGVAFVATSTVE